MISNEESDGVPMKLNDDTNDSAAKKTTKDSAKWDKILNKYEEVVEQYIKLAKKAKQGDVNALTQYAQYMVDAMELQEELEDAKSDLSPAQASRLVKIAAKMTNAATAM